MTLGAYIRNPLVDVVIDRAGGNGGDGEPSQIVISSYSSVRGFARDRLSRSVDGTGFEAATRLLATADEAGLATMALSAHETYTLWRSGLIILPQERAEAFGPNRFELPRDEYAAHGFTLIPQCLTPTATAILVAHYRAETAAGRIPLSEPRYGRNYLHNDPAARVVQASIRSAVEQIVGSPIKSSYTWASLYRGGGSLWKHTDRQQCKYTVSVLIDHRPLPTDGRSPWPVRVYAKPDAPAVECFQSIGGGLLFRGCEVPHDRPATLAPDETCWVLLLHYVDADFDGPLD